MVESGTHEELVKNSLIYSHLWNRQSGGFLAPEEYEKTHSNPKNTIKLMNLIVKKLIPLSFYIKFHKMSEERSPLV